MLKNQSTATSIPVKKYDVLTIGRSSIDLYSQDIGASFENISAFDAFVGGSSTNIAICCQRLGLKTALLTALGNDQVGKFIKHFLEAEGIITQYIPTIEGVRTSAVLLGIEPPNKFPLVYYRENAADLQLTIDHILAANMPDFKVVILSGNALSKMPSQTAVLFAAEQADLMATTVVLDLDFRVDQWHDPRDYGVMIRALLPKVKIVIGTEEEILAAGLINAVNIVVEDQQISAPQISGNLDQAIDNILQEGIDTLIVKRGAAGASIFDRNRQEIQVPGYPVKVLNVLGAGDAFAGGFIYGYLQGWDLYQSCRMGNACGAILVTRHGCANFMPTLSEVSQFVKDKGGM